MTTHNLALYRVLVKLGISEGDAEVAASPADTSALATKADLLLLKQELQTAIAEAGGAIAWKVIGAMVSLTGIFALIVAWLVKR